MPDDAIPFGVPSVGAHLIKVAARITEAAAWVRLTFADTCPKADLFSEVVRSLLPSGDNPDADPPSAVGSESKPRQHLEYAGYRHRAKRFSTSQTRPMLTVLP